MVEVINIPLPKLKKDPMNMRKDPEDVSSLVEEIRRHGWTVPLEVRPLKDGTYGVVCGSRRLHAARVLGLEEVPCIVMEMDDDEAMRRSLADNELPKRLDEDERVAYYRLMVERAGSIRAASKKYSVPKETMRGLLEKYDLLPLLEGGEGEGGQDKINRGQEKANHGNEPKNGGKGGEASRKDAKSAVPKKFGIKVAKEVLKEKLGGEKGGYWKLDKEFLLSLKKDVQERVQSIASKLWEPKVFRLKPNSPALHEVLQKPTILDATPTESWPIGWQPRAVESNGIKMLIPTYELGGDFSSVAVLLCPSCGRVLRGLGKGLPVACLDCGFPSNLYGWKANGSA